MKLLFVLVYNQNIYEKVRIPKANRVSSSSAHLRRCLRSFSRFTLSCCLQTPL